MPDEQSEQLLFEYIYGLLDDDQAAALKRRIVSEPDVARAYAAAKQQTDMLAKAALLHAPKVTLPAGDGAPRRSASPSPAAAAQPIGLFHWLVGLAAMALISTTGYFLAAPASPIRGESLAQVQRDVAQRQLRLLVTGPARHNPAAPGAYSIVTTDAEESPVAARLHYTLLAPTDGAVLLEKTIDADDQGRAVIQLPPQKLTAGALLEVEA
ncbi:MAG: hypothetical protein KDA41_07715, partial [Planctomycetales bacterium]|nr:hypothetical protein [Planctomycetales bacterium]